MLLNSTRFGGILTAVILQAAVPLAHAADFYVAQTPQGAANGTDAADAFGASFFNSAGNWSSPVKVAGEIGPGDTVHLVGTITSVLTIQAGGTVGNLITVLFEPGAIMSSPAWPASGAIVAARVNYVTIDGGTNGIIQCTNNGTGLGTQIPSVGIAAIEASFFTVKNLTVSNLYVRTKGPDVLAGGVGVSDVWNGGSSFSNFTVTNCTFHDMAIGASMDYGPGCSTFEMSNCTAFNCNWGGNAADHNTSSTLNGLLIFGNHFSNWDNWTDTSPANTYHHNGFYGWSEQLGGTAQITNIRAYNNLIGPGFNNVASTSGLFFSGNVIDLLVYNNIFVGANPTDYPADGMIAVWVHSGAYTTNAGIYNNTIYGGGGGAGIWFYQGDNTSGGVTSYIAKNNIIANVSTAITHFLNASGTLISDFNNISNVPTASMFNSSITSSSNFSNLAQWQTLGLDIHSTTIAPAFTSPGSDFHLLPTDSAGIDNGTDLSAFFTTDRDNVTRPQGLAWDIGSYEATPPTVPIIVISPISQTVPTGSNITLSALGRGAAPLSGQWWNGLTMLTGQTGNTLTLNSVTSANNGTYTFIETNGSGSATSSGAVLNVSNAAFVTSQPSSQAVTVGSNVSFTVTAQGIPTPTFQWKFNGAPLSNGGIVSGATTATLSLTGVLTSNAGNYSVTATNSSGSSTSSIASLSVSILPVFTIQPVSQSISQSGTASFAVSASGTPSPTYTWTRNGLALTDGGNIFGSATSNLLITNLSQSDSGSYVAHATNSGGTSASLSATLTVVTGLQPTIIQEPVATTALSGSSVILTFLTTGFPTPSIQWSKNGIQIQGATNSTLNLFDVTTNDAGIYTAIATNSSGTTSSTGATLTVLRPSRLINLSARADVGSTPEVLITGFVISGSNKAILVRGVGPSLAAFAISDPLTTPQIQLNSGPNILQTGTAWGGSSALVSEFSLLGAFPLTNLSSNDAAFLVTLPTGEYTAITSGLNSSTGIALAELYDADTSEAPAGRLINLSARAQVGSAANVLIVGFVVSGDTSEKILLRGIGPGLSTFGITGFLANPVIQLYNASILLQQNSQWGGTTDLTDAFAQVGAFPLTDPHSNDAALIVTLQPGAYTAILSGGAGSTGVALAEIYELP